MVLPTILSCLIAFIFLSTHVAMGQQIDVPRVEQMPNRPQPYEMRDWKAVAHGYDALVFDFDRTGQHLPLGWFVDDPVNYPDQRSFGLATVVGTPPGRERFAEAINVLPALVGASLVGIDKSDQDGVDWVQMAAEFFNRRPEENVYLNTPTSRSGSDWWYETMPNVFFYQLYDLYPDTRHFDQQFTTVADRWLQAVEAMGASTTPWTAPEMNYRAFELSTMTPNESGVPEPEAAGALAWLLYQAHVKTGEPRFRIGAEQAMEYLSGLRQNPSYELQLPYGVVAAARMNAELGTRYDVEKLLNWCFEVGPLRSWGVISDTWGDYGAHGLVGEVSANSYAFLMNGLQQAAALLPVARYDARFARALGKWTLHLANNSRLFYPKYLPPEHQDSDAWAFEYDPESFIGHEAMRETRFGRTPYATGDAVDGGWGYTNLALYGSSHVGYLAALVDTTDVPMVLRLDVGVTDWFGADAFPSYLYYNPHADERAVTVELDGGTYDLYDAVAQAFVARGVTGSMRVVLPADGARLLVATPAGGTTSYDGSHLLVDGVVVDYRARPEAARGPRIRSLAAEHDTVFVEGSTRAYCTPGKAGSSLAHEWSATGGVVDGDGSEVTWTAPAAAGAYGLNCAVVDDAGRRAADSVRVWVSDNHAPTIDSLVARPDVIDAGASTALTCSAQDDDGGPLDYVWQAEAGSVVGAGSDVEWVAPEAPGYYTITCRVRDGDGAAVSATVGVAAGRLVGHWPLDATGDDASGFGNDGAVVGAEPTTDRDGVPQGAYAFDGGDDHMRVASHPSLDVRESITVAFWMQPDRLLDREAFLVSHGSWQHRWKVSLTPEHRPRWTINTDQGIVDVDAPASVEAGTWYFVAATYDGERVRLYLDGHLAGAAAWSGTLGSTTFDLTFGQMLPGDTQYNFAGRIDEARLYNRALQADEVEQLFAKGTAASPGAATEATTLLHPLHPNPFAGTATAVVDVARPGDAVVDVHDVLGRHVATLLDGALQAGRHRITWNAAPTLGTGLYVVRLTMGDVVSSRTVLYVGE